MQRTRRAARVVIPLLAITLAAAACGSSKKAGPSGATTTAGSAAAATTAAAKTDTTVAATATTAAKAADTTAAKAAGGGGVSPACKPDASIDATEGKNAGQFTADIACAATKPLKAAGDPIVIGVQNPQGDPNGSFPEYSSAIDAASKYINEELGGIGGDVSAGKVGRPVKLELCIMAINPADSLKCANELAGKKPFAVISTLNFFGNHFPIYEQAGINVVVGTPITVGDFTGKAFSIGAGGGCLGVHTGLIFAATQTIKAKNVAVPWADTPPGVVCYYDLEKKPLDVLQGAVKGTSKLAGTIPDLKQIGVPVKPATPDITPQVTQILGFKPDAIIFSAQGADCWTLVDGLGRQGWTPDKIPLLLSGACIDFEKMKAAGPLAKGVYFVGAAGAALTAPDTITNVRYKLEATTYLEKAKKYGMDAADITKGFAAQGWSVLMTIWEQANIAAKAGALTAESFKTQMASTSDNHIYGSVPFGCKGAPAPYVAVCNSKVNLTQWDGTTLVTKVDTFSGLDLIAGTDLKPGP